MEQQSNQIQTEPRASERNLISLLYDQLIQADKKKDMATAKKITNVLEIVLINNSDEPQQTFKAHRSTINSENNFRQPNLPNNVYAILKDVLQKPARINEIQEKITQLTGSYRSIREIVKYLVKQDKLVSVKYNDNNRLTYFGLKEWKDEFNNDFKPEFQPNRKNIDTSLKRMDFHEIANE